MSRSPRVEFPGAFYHVTCRGNLRASIFTDDCDREHFLSLLGRVVARSNWRCHAYCLMDNHYHLLLETLEASLSEGMCFLNGAYARHFNGRHRRIGHLTQGRYKSSLVESDPHFMTVSRYLVMNPVRAAIVPHPSLWPWSSYNATAGLETPGPFLSTRFTLALFHEDAGRARLAYREFVDSGETLTTGIDSKGGRQEKRETKPVPAGYGAPVQRLILSDYLGHPRDKEQRDEAIFSAYSTGGYKMREIAEFLGLDVSSISKVVKTTRSMDSGACRPDS